MKKLGIDLGTSSLGWAIFDDDKKDYDDGGVIIFEEGLLSGSDRDSIETPAGKRTGYRMMRRIKFRRKLRKFATLKLLIAYGMCPLSQEELNLWKNKDIYPKENLAFREWLKSGPEKNPYVARAGAAEGKVSPDTLGRAFYHIAQRRGFKSSRKELIHESDETSKSQKEEEGMKAEIAKTTQILNERGITLGQYFYDEIKSGNKVRTRHLSRKAHYEKEFEAICKVQTLPKEQSDALHKAIFYQRPLRSQAHLVGKCPLSGGKRCLVAHPDFERFRMLAFINTIKIKENEEMRFLTSEEREEVKDAFFRKTSYFNFEVMVTKLYSKPKKVKDASWHPEFNYEDDKTIKSCSVSDQLNKLLGVEYSEWTYKYHGKNGCKTYDYQTIFDAIMFFSDNEKLAAFGKEKLGFSDEQCEKLIKITVPEGYAQYSLKVIHQILPFLEIGLNLFTAKFLANIPNLIGNYKFEDNKAQIIGDVLELIKGYRADKENLAREHYIVPLETRLRRYMLDSWNLRNDQLNLLYLKAAENPYSGIDKDASKLPSINLGMMRNPLVMRSLGILKNFINHLRIQGKIDSETHIHIELARNVNDRNTRMAYEKWQKIQETKRMEAREECMGYGIMSPTDDQILRVILWKEQDKMCLYTGKEISISQVLGDNSLFDIEHTIPQSRSGDDSMANNTLCDSHYNRQIKKNMIPTELADHDKIYVRIKPWREKLENLQAKYKKDVQSAKKAPADNPEVKGKARQKAILTRFELDYWQKKVDYFLIPKEDLTSSFMNRQLVDTGIMTRHTLLLLRSIYPKTYAVNGKAVAWARKAWGVQNQYEPKERIDHTHHMIDAMVIAALDQTKFNEICTQFKHNEEEAWIPPRYDEKTWAHVQPMPKFTERVHELTESTLIKFYTRHNEIKKTAKLVHLSKVKHLASGRDLRVVHAQGDTARGQLHKDTFYGCIHNPHTDNQEIYVVRKALSSLKVENLEKIIDPAVRETVMKQIKDYTDKGLAFEKAIQAPIYMKKPCDEFPQGILIKKVRIKAKTSNPKIIKEHRFLSKHEYKQHYFAETGAGSNFKIALFESLNKKGERVVKSEVINLLDYLQKKVDLDSLSKRDGFMGFVPSRGAILIFENSPDELKTMSQKNLAKRLYQNTKYDTRGTFIFHREARASTELEAYLKTIKKKEDGASALNFTTPELLLRLTPSQTFNHMLFEGIHFNISWDGKVKFLF